MKHCWNMKRVLKWGMVLVLMMNCPTIAWAMQWPDTSQDACYNNTQVIPCPTSDTADFHGQDAQFQNPARSYTKLAADGSELPDSATNWVMVRDNVTNLTWEVKTDRDGTSDYTNPHDADNTYRWCDRTIEHFGYCSTGTNDTEDFLTALKNAALGGFTDWRLPTIQELSSLLYIGAPPLVDWSYFPWTISSGTYLAYWSSTIPPQDTGNRWAVSFGSGRTYGPYHGDYNTIDPHPVRAVRGGL